MFKNIKEAINMKRNHVVEVLANDVTNEVVIKESKFPFDKEIRLHVSEVDQLQEYLNEGASYAKTE